jgi:hypothetical protein
MLRRPLWLVVAAELLAAIGDHFFFFGFFAVLAAALNAASARSAGFAFARHALIAARFNALTLGGNVGV